jgi:putative ABC transport system permease protein
MNAFGFAWRSLVRQPARATLGILGVAAVGALLFDMLLLSQGLIVSMRDLLNSGGYDVRVTATADLPRSGPRLSRARETSLAIERLPDVRAALAVRFADVHLGTSDAAPDARTGDAGPATATFEGIWGTADRPWLLLSGRPASGDRDVIVSESAARALGLAAGSPLQLRVTCGAGEEAVPPLPVRVAGIAAFTFELGDELTMAGPMDTLERACGGNVHDEADMILVVSAGDPARTAAAIRANHPDVRAATNDEMLGRIQEGGFTYFRQISSVLTTVTVTFSALLIAVLLTVSVNQRLGEIAALRALGFSRRRMVADVLSESVLIVGIGGLLSLPLGWVLALLLDDILRAMPGIPAQLHFFVYQPRALILHLTLLAITALLAALYPMRIVARLPIAATLRAEVVG